MAADRYFCEFIEPVMRADEFLYDHRDERVLVPRSRLKERLNLIEVFNDREFLVRYRFAKEQWQASWSPCR
ncbi:hypothetical protein HPB47_004103 [Ixodes persulcatus]|uniref:Uncharacterized protein n=1 Tax=Ixodes persulcatus TaxID=34615 RepID=A0AC60PGL3_IXOPE|nr:hypothetical protein HPB47_004103 [Ixodes persulcatus]